MLGHPSIDTTRLTTKELGLQLTGWLKHCENCKLAKIWKKNMNNVSESVSKTPGERLLMDISFITQESLGERNLWVLVEDQFSNMKWSIFTRKKSDMVKEMITLIKKLKAKDPKNVSFLRMDNAAENVSLMSNLEKEGIQVEVEFTSPITPEQKGQVERSFATLWGRLNPMLNDFGVEKDFRNKLWAECASTATKLSNLIERTKEGSPYELFHGKKQKVGRNLRIFGEVGIKVTRTQVHHEKLNSKGNECILVGYKENHPQDETGFSILGTRPS